MPVSVDAETIATLTAESCSARFAATYRRKYGYYYDDVPVELVTVHVTGAAGAEIDALPELAMLARRCAVRACGRGAMPTPRGGAASCRSQSTAAIACSRA